jgi:integrase
VPLTVYRRTDRGKTLYLTGRIHLPGGQVVRVRQRAASNRLALAREEAAALEARILRDGWHGERRGARSFAEAVTSYIKAEPREPAEVARLDRVLRGLGDVTLGEINQETMDGLRDKLLQPGASPATITRAIITPVRTVMRHAHRRGWCDPPLFEIPRQPKGRTLYMLPAEVERLVAASAAHLEPIILFLIDTGARVSECLSLQWRDVDLGGARAILWMTKNGHRRDVPLGPRTIAALASLPHRDGAVFRWSLRRGAVELTRAYADQGLGWGGQIKKAWAGAIRRAGLDPAFTPHVLRHSWASWHYAAHRDLLLLKRDGDWSSVTLCERYAHLLPGGQEDGIRQFWGHRAGLGVLPQEKASA